MTRHLSRTRTAIAGLLVCGGMLAAGCVSQERYDDTELSARALQARNQELLQENEALEQALSGKDRTIVELERQRSQLSDRVSGLNNQLAALRDNLDQLDERLTSVRLSAIDPATDRELRALAQRYPNVITYDAELGMLRFGSDVTFDSGSATLRNEAQETIRQLGRILMAVDATGYDVQIVGHTDSVPITRSRQRFPTNRHLSVARAISVARALQTAGVPGVRLMTAGWGEYRPAVANNPSGGTRANRRVEVFLVPSTASAAPAAPAAGETASPQRAEPDPLDTPMK